MARIAPQIRRLYDMCAMAIVSGRGDLEGAQRAHFDIDLPVFSVGRAAELADIHPQTLRQYDRMGMVVPQRTSGGARRYSLRDINRINQAQHLSQDDGVNLTGIMRIMALEEENEKLRAHIAQLTAPQQQSIFTANPEGDIVQMRRSRHMKHWRAQLRTEPRELPSRPSATGQSVVLWDADNTYRGDL